MNLTRAEKVRLGAFILVGLLVLVGTIVVLTGMQVWERRDHYSVTFTENVAGLEVSGQVKYQGLRVGRVDSMKIDPDNPGAILVDLSLEPGTPLYEGTRAALEMNGMTGLKVVNLEAGDLRSERIQPGARLPAGPSLIGTLSERAEAISMRAERVLANLEEWTKPANITRLTRLMDTADALLKDVDHFLVETEQPLVKVLDEVGKSGAAFRGLAVESSRSMRELRGEVRRTLVAARGTLQQTDRLLGAVPTTDVTKTVKTASALMSTLNKQLSTDEMQRLFVELKEALANLTRLAQSMDLTVRASREDLVLSLQHARQATQDLRDFSRLIAQDPSVLLRGTEASE